MKLNCSVCMYVCTCICISFLIAVCGTLFFNSQNFYAMNDVFLFCMYLQTSCECILFQCQVVYIYQVSCIYRHILLLQLPFYRSEMRLYILWPDISQIWSRTGCEEIFTYSSELLCMWSAIFLIDHDALIIPQTWYVLNECLKVCHI